MGGRASAHPSIVSTPAITWPTLAQQVGGGLVLLGLGVFFAGFVLALIIYTGPIWLASAPAWLAGAPAWSGIAIALMGGVMALFGGVTYVVGKGQELRSSPPAIERQESNYGNIEAPKTMPKGMSGEVKGTKDEPTTQVQQPKEQTPAVTVQEKTQEQTPKPTADTCPTGKPADQETFTGTQAQYTAARAEARDGAVTYFQKLQAGDYGEAYDQLYDPRQYTKAEFTSAMTSIGADQSTYQVGGEACVQYLGRPPDIAFGIWGVPVAITTPSSEVVTKKYNFVPYYDQVTDGLRGGASHMLNEDELKLIDEHLSSTPSASATPTAQSTQSMSEDEGARLAVENGAKEYFSFLEQGEYEMAYDMSHAPAMGLTIEYSKDQYVQAMDSIGANQSTYDVWPKETFTPQPSPAGGITGAYYVKVDIHTPSGETVSKQFRFFPAGETAVHELEPWEEQLIDDQL